MIELQNPHELVVPSAVLFEQWAQLALPSDEQGECVVRIVSLEESQQYNHEFRGKDYPTNVLSFPYEQPELPAGVILDEEDEDYLGDLLICADVVEREAQEQNKPSESHWAHMVIHGMLHLQGYDHIEDEEADIMEALETKLLGMLDIPDPYQLIDKEQ